MSEHPILSLFLAEAESGRATARSLAVLYALILAGGEHVHRNDWIVVNQALYAALSFRSPKQFDAFRRTAWSIVDAADDRQQASLGLTVASAHEAPRAVQ